VRAFQRGIDDLEMCLFATAQSDPTRSVRLRNVEATAVDVASQLDQRARAHGPSGQDAGEEALAMRATH
jgi:hypothetical protein